MTVVLVGIIGAVLMGFGMAEPAPILGISIGHQGNIIKVTHLNGAELPVGTYKILVDDVDKTADFMGDVDFGPGITLTWDSGMEAVGMVSVVYTGTNGGETVLAQKNIGKAGSGVVNHQILEIDGTEYALLDSVWDGGGEWQNILDEANESTTGSITLAEDKIYYDGTYWWARNYHGYSLTTDQAQNDLNIAEYMEDVGTGTEGWVKFNTTHVRVGSIDTYPPEAFRGKLVFYELVTTGTLLYNDTKLYLWSSNFPTTDFYPDDASQPWGWNQIGTLYSP